MAKEWIIGKEGRNLKFKRETLLNYGINRWGLNKAYSVNGTSALIRKCSPKSFEEWDDYYFKNAKQKKRDGFKITREYITELGRKLCVKLSEVVQNELESITEEECIDYAYNLVLNRTYEGYLGEIQTIYGQLEKIIEVKIHPAPDIWDRTYNVDFYIQVGDKYIGLQIKPISSGMALDQYQWDEIQESTHKKFTKKFGGEVFYIFSIKKGNQKIIYNLDVIEELKEEIKRLQQN